MSFGEVFHPDYESSKIEEDAKYLSTRNDQIVDTKEAGKYVDKNKGNPTENPVSVSKIPDGQRGKIINDEIADQTSAIMMIENANKPGATWPPIDTIDNLNSIGINDTSSSTAKANIGGTEGGVNESLHT